MQIDRSCFINGKWVIPAGERWFELIDPSTAKKYSRIRMAGVSETTEAVKAAFKSKTEWTNMGYSSRRQVLHKFADLLEGNADELADVESKNQGMPVRYAREDVILAAKSIRYYADLAAELKGTLFSNEFSTQSYNKVYPLGVCAIITPWNYPLFTAIQGIAPALAAGNTVVYKPSEITPLSSIVMFELVKESGFPPGVMNLLVGTGRDVGKCLGTSPLVAKVTFTGSTDTGRDILKGTASNFKSVNVELGGKSPFIVFDDADFYRAVDDCVMAILTNSGQICVAGSRLIIENSVKDRFLSELVQKFKDMRLGRRTNDHTDLGPMVSKEHFDSVMSYIDDAISAGEKLICGGKKAVFETGSDLNEGYFIEPTIFDDVSKDSPIWKEEIFGPVLVVKGFDTVEEAIDLANDTQYGLASGVYSEDYRKAEAVADQIDAGIVWINCYYSGSKGSHSMGWKNSGRGYHGGLEGLKGYTKSKQINKRL